MKEIIHIEDHLPGKDLSKIKDLDLYQKNGDWLRHVLITITSDAVVLREKFGMIGTQEEVNLMLSHIALEIGNFASNR